MNGLDLGLNIGAGYHIADNMLISYQLSFGLSNLQPKADGVSDLRKDFKITNTTCFLLLISLTRETLLIRPSLNAWPFY